jgi:hypothetical protein
MSRPTPLNSPALSVLKFTPKEKSAAQIGPDGLTESQRARGRPLGPDGIVSLVDRLFRAKVVTDATAEHVPRMRERVCVEGRDELFVVIYVDRERAVADLVSIGQVGELMESVAFSAIYPEPPQAA